MKKLIVLLFVLSIVPIYALDIHVATNGSDSNKGTKSNPLLTIKAAQAKLRASGVIGKEACKIIRTKYRTYICLGYSCGKKRF